MSLIKFNESAPAPVYQDQPKDPINYAPVAVDNSIRPIDTLLPQIEGMPVIVHFYQELRDGKSTTHGHDVGKSNVLQQYKRIQRLEIKLDGDIDQDQNDETKEFNIRGSAFVYAGVVPNAGDMFVMDVGNRRTGVFQISNSKRMTALNETVYRIEFIKVFYTSDRDRFDDMVSKVVQDTHFIKDFAQFGKEAVVTTTTFDSLKKLATYKHEIISDYLREFLNVERMALLIDVSGKTMIDPYTTSSFRDLVNSKVHPEIERIKFFTVVLDDGHQDPTLWHALAQRRANLLVGARTRSAIVSNNYFARRPKLNSLRWSGIQQFIMPTTALEASTSAQYRADDTSPVYDNERATAAPSVYQTMVDLHPPFSGGTYILSSAFYNRESDVSILESLTLDFLDRKSVDPHALAWLLSNHTGWSKSQKYFYFPIVLALIQSVLLDAS